MNEGQRINKLISKIQHYWEIFLHIEDGEIDIRNCGFI